MEPNPLEYVVVVFCCLVFAVIGLYLLANFSRLFRGRIKNELLRKNIVSWLIIFFLSSATAPITGGLYFIVGKFGWLGTVACQAAITTLYTLIVFNSALAIAENKR